VNYTSPNAAGTLSFTPASGSYGTATVTVTINDNGAGNNIVMQSFTVTVNAPNQPPTLDALPNLTINENAGLQTVNLGGITAGANNQWQTLTVTAVSSNPDLIPNPTVNYNNSSPSTTGTLNFASAANNCGTATITVTVNNNGASNSIVTHSFTVTVNGLNQPPTLDPLNNLIVIVNSGKQLVSLTGISSGLTNTSQMVTVRATSSNPILIPTPAISYLFPNSYGTLSFTPAVGIPGTAVISVTVNNGQITSNVITRQFTVTIVTAVSAGKVSAALAPATPPSRGQFALNVNGVTGYTYVVQVSTNMVNWDSVLTNTAPFIFVDTNACRFKQRFYRSFYLQ
jgi:hypothetical protein